MLLAQYLTEVYPGSAVARTWHELAYGDTITFGERYLIRTAPGVSYDIPDLEEMLGIIRDEFMAVYKVPDICFERRPNMSDPMAQRESSRALVIRVPAWQFVGAAPEYHVAMYISIKRIRDAVTMYNLTQSWDHFDKENKE